jgi:glycerol uptake facilitator-like aquaporin
MGVWVVPTAAVPVPCWCAGFRRLLDPVGVRRRGPPPTGAATATALAAPSIGFALIAAVLIGGPSTGGAVNPDRALGPVIMSGNFDSIWVYLVGRILGGVAAALLYNKVVAPATAPTTDEETDAADRSIGTGDDTQPDDHR